MGVATSCCTTIQKEVREPLDCGTLPVQPDEQNQMITTETAADDNDLLSSLSSLSSLSTRSSIKINALNALERVDLLVSGYIQKIATSFSNDDHDDRNHSFKVFYLVPPLVIGLCIAYTPKEDDRFVGCKNKDIMVYDGGHSIKCLDYNGNSDMGSPRADGEFEIDCNLSKNKDVSFRWTLTVHDDGFKSISIGIAEEHLHSPYNIHYRLRADGSAWNGTRCIRKSNGNGPVSGDVIEMTLDLTARTLTYYKLKKSHRNSKQILFQFRNISLQNIKYHLSIRMQYGGTITLNSFWVDLIC